MTWSRADDDGIVIAPVAQLQACITHAEEIERVEAKVLGEVARRRRR